MKKLILLMSVLGLFVLISCNKTPNVDSSSSNQEPITESVPTNENEPTNKDTSEQTQNDNTDASNPLEDYNDGGDWHGKID